MYKEINLIAPYTNTMSVYTPNAVLGAAPDWTAVFTSLITNLVQQGFSYLQAETKAKQELKALQLKYAQEQQQNPGGAGASKDNTMLYALLGLGILFFVMK